VHKDTPTPVCTSSELTDENILMFSIMCRVKLMNDRVAVIIRHHVVTYDYCIAYCFMCVDTVCLRCDNLVSQHLCILHCVQDAYI